MRTIAIFWTTILTLGFVACQETSEEQNILKPNPMTECLSGLEVVLNFDSDLNISKNLIVSYTPYYSLNQLSIDSTQTNTCDYETAVRSHYRDGNLISEVHYDPKYASSGFKDNQYRLLDDGFFMPVPIQFDLKISDCSGNILFLVEKHIVNAPNDIEISNPSPSAPCDGWSVYKLQLDAETRNTSE